MVAKSKYGTALGVLEMVVEPGVVPGTAEVVTGGRWVWDGERMNANGVRTQRVDPMRTVRWTVNGAVSMGNLWEGLFEFMCAVRQSARMVQWSLRIKPGVDDFHAGAVMAMAMAVGRELGVTVGGVLDGHSAEAVSGALAARVVACVRGKPGQDGIDVAQALGLDVGVVYDVVDELVKEGVLERGYGGRILRVVE